LIVGLGNPGSRYVGTRHNIGFIVADRLAKGWSIVPGSRLCRCQVGLGKVGKRAVRVAFAQTFMNASGEAVECLARRWRVAPSSVLVICDDIALPLGSVRLRAQGSDGGHLGLASIIGALGTQEIPRLRVGIRPRQEPSDLTEFVLSPFEPSEQTLLEEGVSQAVDACQSWVTQGITAAMNRFNRRLSSSRKGGS